jgi:predicted transcriptional regulator
MRRKEIKKWLIDKGLSQAQIAKEAKVSTALVSLTIKGERRNDEVLRVMREHGMSDELLCRQCDEMAV